MSDPAATLWRMTQISPMTDHTVAKVLRRQGGLITRAQAQSIGMTKSALRHKLRVGGPWRVVLPGVYLNQNGPLTAGQREVAAVLYAGGGCVITGLAALQAQGVRAPLTEFVDVLIPNASKRQSVAFVRTHRTTRMPEHPWLAQSLRWAPTARAVADAGRSGLELGDFRALMADAIQRRKCTISQLAYEMRIGPKRGSATLRAVLAEVAGGAASAAEVDLHRLVKSGHLPEPLYNPSLYVGAEFLARPDLWWRDAGVAGELDSREWHLSPDLWRRTMARHARMSARGIIVLHFPPSRIRSDDANVLAELRSAIEAGLQRPALAIRTVPSQ